MTLVEENGPERGGDEILAAEYVLGVLPEDERQIVATRVDREPDFARLVDEWEVRFAPLAAAYPAVEPPVAVKPAIDRRLFPDAAPAAAIPEAVAAEAPDRPEGLWSSLAFWRALAAAAVAALAIYIALPYVRPTSEAPQPLLAASLSADGSDVRYLAVYDSRRGEIGLSQLSGSRASGKDFELWMIEGGNAPVSMGVIPASATAHMRVADADRAKLAAGAVLAVSLEPTGGSPTGQPTGPVVAAGDLKGI
ncbi:anti-sigma factor [Rhizobiaceae sp. 2RAB30]